MVSVEALLSQQKIPILLKPNASQTQILGVRDDRLHVAIHAPPIEGKANDALCKFLIKLTHKKCVVIVGARSRKKLVECS